MTKKGVDAEKAPTVIAMAEALSERNLGLMGAILALMIRAEAEPLYRQVGLQNRDMLTVLNDISFCVRSGWMEGAEKRMRRCWRPL